MNCRSIRWRSLPGGPAPAVRPIYPRNRRDGHLGHLFAQPADLWGLAVGSRSLRASFSLLAAPPGSRDHPHLGFLHHRQISLSFQPAALERRADLRLGDGRRGHGQDQQEPRRRADGAAGDDRKLFRGCAALLGRLDQPGQRCPDQRREDPDGHPPGHQAVERGPLCRTLHHPTPRRLSIPSAFSPADRWILARLQQVVRRATTAMLDYDYAAAKAEVEAFFWKDLADNYLEMAKQRLYNPDHPQHPGAVYACRPCCSPCSSCWRPSSLT